MSKFRVGDRAVLNLDTNVMGGFIKGLEVEITAVLGPEAGFSRPVVRTNSARAAGYLLYADTLDPMPPSSPFEAEVMSYIRSELQP